MSGGIGFFGHTISDELSLRVGRLIVLWATFENRLDYVIWTVAGLRGDDGRLFTSRHDLRPKEEILDGLLALRAVDDETRATWREMRGLIATVTPLRNLITHGRWMSPFEDQVIIGLSRREGAEFITLDRLDRAAADATRLLELLSTLRLPNTDARLPLLETRRPPSRGRSPSQDRTHSKRQGPPRSSRASR